MLLHLMGSASDGGAETYFLQLAEAFRDAGIPQCAALRAHPARERALAELGIPFVVLPFRRLDLTTKARVATYARRMGAGTLLAWMSRSASRMPGGPWRRVGRLGGYYNLRFFRGCDLLVANTQDIHDYILREGWPPQKVLTIANFAAADALPALPRAALDTPDDVPLLLSMGRLHQEKGHDVTLRALTQLPDAILWLAGSGPEEAALKAQAQSLGVADRVRFLGWREDPGALYRAADLVVFPSREEPLGNVVIQAWVHGVPVISSRAIGPAHLIRDGEDGVLVPVGDSAALAAGIGRLLGDATLRARLVAAGAARAPEFDRDAVVARWRSVLEI